MIRISRPRSYVKFPWNGHAYTIRELGLELCYYVIDTLDIFEQRYVIGFYSRPIIVKKYGLLEYFELP